LHSAFKKIKGIEIMKYISTRNIENKVSGAMAIKEGLSLEGGLFVPESLPALTKEDYDYLVSASYTQRAAYILNKFLDDFSISELTTFSELAYSKEKFGGEATPIYEYDENTYFLELWHGPTCAFKDMALQMLPHLLIASTKKTGDDRTVLILVATSGDTGKAALDGFCDVDGSKIIVFYPKDGVSEIQRTQMITQEGKNVFICGVDGNFDDAQTGVKNIFTNNEYNQALNEKGIILSSANSINWGRLVPQIVYYVSSYCDLLQKDKIKLGDKINICVPTGNFGNILAAYYAKNMGIPIDKLICASNSNNVLTEFINTGVYDKNRDFILTMSPSMDILISSNLERYIFGASGNDDNYIKDIMQKLGQTGKYEVTDEIKSKISKDFYANFADEQETLDEISSSFKEKSYLMDTHTAVAANVLKKYRAETNDQTITIIASTANPYKFNESVLKALNVETDGIQDEFELLELLQKSSNLKIPTQLSDLKTKEKRFNSTCDKENMIDIVTKFVG
jgi:threonine synthase